MFRKLKAFSHHQQLFALCLTAIIAFSFGFGLNDIKQHTNRSVGLDGALHSKNQDPLEKKSLPPRVSGNQPILYYTELPIEGLVNNKNRSSQLLESHMNLEKASTRPTTIRSTYLATLGLRNLGWSYFESRIDAIDQALMQFFNETTSHFSDKVNYTWIEQQKPTGTLVRGALLTPNVSHQIAIACLAELGTLNHHFSSAQQAIWETEIKQQINRDGGFGTLHAPHSTIYESMVATRALYHLNNRSTNYLSPAQRSGLQSFTESLQFGSGEYLDFVEGSFREYGSADPYSGWEVFDVSLQALKIFEFAGLSMDIVRTPFFNFLNDNEIFDEENHHFIRRWNDKSTCGGSPAGTAVIGGCISVLGGETTFEVQLDDSLSYFTTRYSDLGISTGQNYVYQDSSKRYNLYYESLILQHLNRSNTINQALNESERQGIAQYFENLWCQNGFSFYSCKEKTLETLAQSSTMLSSQSECDLQEFSQIIYDLVEDSIVRDSNGLFFVDSCIKQPNPISNYESNKWKTLESTFYAVKSLNQLGLFEDLYAELDMEWLDIEQWIANQLQDEGFFSYNKQINYAHNPTKAAYLALQSLQWLFDFNIGQTFSAYFTEEELQSIERFLDHFIIEENDMWYARDNAIPQKTQTDLQTTYYVVKIFELLQVNSTKVNRDGLTAYFEHRLSNLDPNNQDSLIQFVANALPLVKETKHNQNQSFNSWMGENLPNIHQAAKHVLEDQIANNHVNPTFIAFLNQLYLNGEDMCYLKIPAEQQPDRISTYKIQIADFWTGLSVEDISQLAIEGEGELFDEWSGDGIFSAPIKPEFVPETPFMWEPTLQYNRGGLKVIPLRIEFASLGEISSSLKEYSDKFEWQITITSSPRVIDALSYLIELWELSTEDGGNFMYNVEPSDASRSTSADSIEISIELLKTGLNTVESNEYKLVVNFDNQLLEPQEVSFSFDKQAWIQLQQSSTETNNESNSEETINDESDLSEIEDRRSPKNDGEADENFSSFDKYTGILMVGITAVPGYSTVVRIKKRKGTDDLKEIVKDN